MPQVPCPANLQQRNSRKPSNTIEQSAFAHMIHPANWTEKGSRTDMKQSSALGQNIWHPIMDLGNASLLIGSKSTSKASNPQVRPNLIGQKYKHRAFTEFKGKNYTLSIQSIAAYAPANHLFDAVPKVPSCCARSL
eukprot:78934-Pelagomonas_calceolata.AAC.2